MSLRPWLAGFFSDLADRFGGDGHSTANPTVGDPDYRFDAWSARVQQRTMRVGPWLAGAGALALVFGLLKFWQVATKPGFGHAPAAEPQATGTPPDVQGEADAVAKRLQTGFKVDQMKRELAADAQFSAPPAYSASPARPLVYFFPPGESYGAAYSYPRPGAPASVGPQGPLTVVTDPWGDALRHYAQELEAERAGHSATSDGADNRGMAGRNGILARPKS